MVINRLYRMVPLLLLTLMTSISCRTSDNSNGSDVNSFGWDEDLEELPDQPDSGTTPGAGGPVVVDHHTTNYDDGTNKCGDIPEGQACLSIVMRIPTNGLINNLGLSTLSLASQSKHMATRLEEACYSAASDYKERYNNPQSRVTAPVRNRFVKTITKTRCVFKFMTEEYNGIEKLVLGKKEIGFSVRLTEFKLTGTEQNAQLGILKMVNDRTKVETKFRNAAFFVGEKLPGGTSSWKSISGLGIGQIAFKKNIPLGTTFEWNIDFNMLKQDIENLVTNPPENLGSAATTFISTAKSALAGSFGSSLVLVGMGHNAMKSVCGEDQSRCSFTQATTNTTEEINFAEVGVPSTDTNEIFRMAVIQMVEGVLDSIFTKGNKKQLTNPLVP